MKTEYVFFKIQIPFYRKVLCILLGFTLGVILHELSHLLMAKLLKVHVTKLELNYNSGCVYCFKTSAFKSFSIAIAPVFIFLILSFFVEFTLFQYLMLFKIKHASFNQLILSSMWLSYKLIFSIVTWITTWLSKGDIINAKLFYKEWKYLS